ncbi:MAG: hypothetical protein ACKOA9_05085 [Actinomycetota bacterium]
MAELTTYLVFSNPVAGTEDEFNRWYDEVHLPEVLATPGIRSAQRFRLLETDITHNSVMPKPTHGYLLIYEIDGDADAVMAKIQDAAMSGAMQMSDSLDLETVAMSFWQPLGEKVVKPDGHV